jgi:Fe-S-cluster-containing hydrogenase component 2
MGHLGLFNPRKAYLRVKINRQPQINTTPEEINIPTVCHQCNPAPCAEACPEGAIVLVSTGAWVVQKEKCTGCGNCKEACSYEMISIDPSKNFAEKCNLCEGAPICVFYCPTGALYF